MHPEVARHRDAIAELCRRHGVTRLEVFGSAARGEEFDPARSDVDLLVEFGPGVRRSFATLFGFEDDVSQLLKRRVDVVEFEALAENPNPLKRKSMLADAQPLFRI